MVVTTVEEIGALTSHFAQTSTASIVLANI